MAVRLVAAAATFTFVMPFVAAQPVTSPATARAADESIDATMQDGLLKRGTPDAVAAKLASADQGDLAVPCRAVPALAVTYQLNTVVPLPYDSNDGTADATQTTYDALSTTRLTRSTRAHGSAIVANGNGVGQVVGSPPVNSSMSPIRQLLAPRRSSRRRSDTRTFRWG